MKPYEIVNYGDVDAVLDGHSHSVISCEYVNNKDGEKVLLSSTGTKLSYIGQLMITEDGLLTTTLINTYPDQDETVAAYISEKKVEFDENDMFASCGNTRRVKDVE